MLPSLLSERLFLGDGGVETTMIFDEGIELPEFASFVLLDDETGIDALRRYYGGYIAIARAHRLGFTLDTPTWRASRDWGEELGYSPAALAEANRRAVALGEEIRAAEEGPDNPIAVCGTLGPRADAYSDESEMSPAEAEAYHSEQISTFAGTAAEMVSAYTLPYAGEAIGMVRAAGAAGIPISISFTVETDGRLPSGQALGDAIVQVDEETGGGAAYFMVNCAHPTHFARAVEAGGEWLARIGGFRPNASRKSHAELDEASDLDRGDPGELGRLYTELKPRLANLRVLGGCCGTDTRHVAAICDDWLGDR
ncbi:MAG TPA: homocysteine S-methyltransferase family protein [Solirubrobacterales bacterium]|jgi:homocysteine S-methyltransferase|nr:homocysteine S-methyltransferase family protein [Solirubrobacterales bacterium]